MRYKYKSEPVPDKPFDMGWRPEQPVLNVAPVKKTRIEPAVADTECPRSDDTPHFRIGPYWFAPTNCNNTSQREAAREIIEQIVERYNR